MADLDFPSSPTVGQQYGNWVWNGSQWDFAATLPGGLPAGSIIQWGGTTAPANWYICDGSAVSRATNASLFAAIGTTYGAGDGSTTFNLPDLRGRVPVGKNGGSFGTLGASGGAETIALAAANLPPHTHSGTTSTTGNHTHGVKTGQGHDDNNGINGQGANAQIVQESDQPRLDYYSYPTYSGDHNHTFTTDGGSGLNGTAFSNLQPYQVVNYIIKTTAAATPGDSELASRVGATETVSAAQNVRISSLETVNIISGQMGTNGNVFAGSKVPFDDFWVQRGITYNSSTRRFTVPIAGIYRIQMSAFTLSGYSGTRVMIGINNDAPDNATGHRGHIYNQDSNHSSMDLHSVVQLNAGDWIVFYVSAGALYNNSGDRFNQFSIERISS